MNKELLAEIIVHIIGIAAFMLLWPLIKWLAIACLVFVVLFTVYVYFSSKKVKKEIMKNPENYYENTNVNKDVIDVEYKEREVVEEER